MKNTRAINMFGSKVMNAHRYPKPRHDLIIEPFAGGAGYSLLHHEHQVILTDIRPEIVGVWQYLIAADPEEIRALPLIGEGQWVKDLECSEGGRLLISWCCNQSAIPAKRPSSWAVYHSINRNAACYWGAARREQAAKIAAKVKHWNVCFPNEIHIGGLRATWFIDPPYSYMPKGYRTAPLDYVTLAQWCRDRQGQVIVCEQADATWLPFRPLYEAPTQKRMAGKRTTCREGIWTNDAIGAAA